MLTGTLPPNFYSNSFFSVRFHDAMEAIRTGCPVILLDDFDRENEADLDEACFACADD